MSANIAPIFPLTPNIGKNTLTTANTAKDGTGTVALVFTAGTNGSRVEKIRAVNTGTATQTVLRVFLNDGQGVLAANNILLEEKTIPATSLSETSQQKAVDIPLDIALPAGWKINCTIGTTVAAALAISCHGGDF